MRPISLAAAVLAVLVSGCSGTSLARLFPRSEEKTSLQKTVDENKRLQALYDAEHELNMKLAYDLESTRVELQKARAALAAKGAEAAPATSAFRDFEANNIRFGLLTGPADWDGKPGIDGFKVYLLVEDSEGSTLKRKGNVAFDLIDISRRQENVIMSWAVPADVFGGYWRSLPPGFRVTLPWRGDVPWGHEVVLRATFTDAYGRTFETAATFKLANDLKDTEERGTEDAKESGE